MKKEQIDYMKKEVIVLPIVVIVFLTFLPFPVGLGLSLPIPFLTWYEHK